MEQEFILWIKAKLIDQQNSLFSSLCSLNKIKISVILNKIDKAHTMILYRVFASPQHLISFIKQFTISFPDIDLELFEYRTK